MKWINLTDKQPSQNWRGIVRKVGYKTTNGLFLFWYDGLNKYTGVFFEPNSISAGIDTDLSKYEWLDESEEVDPRQTYKQLKLHIEELQVKYDGLIDSIKAVEGSTPKEAFNAARVKEVDQNNGQEIGYLFPTYEDYFKCLITEEPQQTLGIKGDEPFRDSDDVEEGHILVSVPVGSYIVTPDELAELAKEKALKEHQDKEEVFEFGGKHKYYELIPYGEVVKLLKEQHSNTKFDAVELVKSHIRASGYYNELRPLQKDIAQLKQRKPV